MASRDAQKYLFVLQDSEDVRLEGVTILNAPLWNVRLQDCNRVWIRGIFLYSDLQRGVNSDGIDIVSSSNVFISDSIISTDDRSLDGGVIAWNHIREVRVARGDKGFGIYLDSGSASWEARASLKSAK